MAVTSETVACLCVTHKRLAFLKHAIRCFMHQTYVPRKLVIVYGDDDVETSDFITSQLDDARIRSVRVESTKRIPLGTLRNIAIENAEAPLIAQWDDDDWHAPRRIESQARTLRKSRADACILQRWMIFDCRTRKVFVSAARYWEASILAWTDKLPPYPALRRAEDTAVVEQLVRRHRVVLLDRPELYVYTFHGGNTWNASHWDRNILPYVSELDAADSEFFRSKLAQHLNHENVARDRGHLAARFKSRLSDFFKKNGRARRP